MSDFSRGAIILVVLAQGVAAVACGGDGSVTGPTTVAPSPPATAAPSGGAPAGGISGEYTLTVTAGTCEPQQPPLSPVAGFPNELKTRTYGATVTVTTYSPNTFDVWLGRQGFLEGFDSAERFGFDIADGRARFWLGSLAGQPAFVEQLSATAYLAIGGAAIASVPQSATSFAADMDGYFEYCVMKSPDAFPVEGSPWKQYSCTPEKAQTHVRCQSHGHRLNWERR